MRVLIALLCLFCAAPLMAEVSDAQFETALASWRKFEMPEPPADAPLVVLEDSARSTHNGEPVPPSRVPAFVLRKPKDDQPGAYLLGAFEVANGRFNRIDFDPDNLEMDRMISAYVGAPFPVNHWFAMALACWAREHHELARNLLAFAMNERPHTEGGVVPEFTTIEGWTAGTIWNYHANRLFEADSERAEVFDLFKNALDQLDSLHEGHSEFLIQLEATLKPSTADPDTPEALIDSLTELHSDNGASFGGLSFEPTDTEIALLAAGFDAVPAMIAHVNDDRMTRSYYTPLFGGSAQVVAVSDIVAAVLSELACERFDSYYDSKAERRLYPVERVRKWWDSVKQLNEQQYLLGKLSVPPGSPGRQLPRVVGAKYPESLGKYFAELIEHPPEEFNYRLPEFVAASNLPDDEKVRLLKMASASEVTQLRLPSLEQLRALDNDAFITLMVKHLDGLASDDKTVHWGSPLIHAYAHLVFDATDKRLWDALARAMTRQDVDARMKVLQCTGYGFKTAENANERLAFLARFLTDDTERWRANREYLPAQEWSMIRVGQFAAMQIGWMLKLKTEPDTAWSTDRWNEFKAEVRKALEADGIQPPDDE